MSLSFLLVSGGLFLFIVSNIDLILASPPSRHEEEPLGRKVIAGVLILSTDVLLHFPRPYVSLSNPPTAAFRCFFLWTQLRSIFKLRNSLDFLFQLLLAPSLFLVQSFPLQNLCRASAHLIHTCWSHSINFCFCGFLPILAFLRAVTTFQLRLSSSPFFFQSDLPGSISSSGALLFILLFEDPSFFSNARTLSSPVYHFLSHRKTQRTYNTSPQADDSLQPLPIVRVL